MILMQTRSAESEKAWQDGVMVLCGSLDDVCAKTARPVGVFDERVCAFLDDVSRRLMKDKRAKAYPDVMTFGFFCRRGNISKLAAKYPDEGRMGRGLVLHIAPSNVPVNFAYTLVFGLLAGNSCVVKASSKDFEQVHIICDVMNDVLKDERFARLRAAICVVEYPRDRQDVTEQLSGICNARVIWGGDQTIEAVRRAPLAPRAYDMAFADRYSLAVFSADAVLEAAEADGKRLAQLAQDFYNDTYLYDQNACSSPRLICWMGDESTVSGAKKVFWRAVYDNIKYRYPAEAVVAVDKLLAVCRTAVTIGGSRIEPMPDNRIMCVEVPELSAELPELRAAGGLYHEYRMDSLEPLADIVDEKYQTIAVYGVDAARVRDFVIEHGLRGVDRIVPVGYTADMGLIWDGYDWIRSLSRIVALA